MGDLTFPWKPTFELIHITGRGWKGRRTEAVLSGPTVVSWESKGRVHPNQKPEWIAEHLIEKLPSDAVICDPFMGAGFVAVACTRLGRRFVGVEIDAGYFATACRRVEAAYQQTDLFVRSAEVPAKQEVLL